ncbi:MAG: MBL fold metallo-hydrolase [Gammaproteobacteria bacterium]|nr:MBL fold metallo-hydrolase [Gammaproteobacteria bacterium]
MLKLLKVGHCFHPEAMVMKGHSWQSMQFPAIVGLIKHPQKGYVLFDTGYAKRFKQETERFPERFYRWLTPFHICEKESLVYQLSQLNIGADEINAIFISHFHADHISGLLDFPSASFICSKVALDTFISLGRIKGLIKGYLPKLLPSDFVKRCSFIEDTKKIIIRNKYAPFSAGYDVFSDGGFIAIPLPGHAVGQFGLLLESSGKSCFLIGDACWTREAYQEGVRPNILTYAIMDNGKQYLETLDKLSQVYLSNKKIQIIPSHCQLSFESFKSG